MATATITTTRTKKKSKAHKGDSQNDPVVILKSLYPPAARAFLRRDVVQTQSLVDAAFSTLHAHPASLSDPLDSHRRKWDLLRITLETTLYSDPLPVEPDILPSSLRSNLLLTPSDFLESLHARSLRLYTPTVTPPLTPSPLYLPAQTLVALVFACVKLGCPEIGRNMVEAWLARRGDLPLRQDPSTGAIIETPGLNANPEHYERVMDAYCLHVLPRLGEWEYAMDFLKHEPELTYEKKKHIYTSLKTLHTQAMNPPPPPVKPVRATASPNDADVGGSNAHRAISPASSGSSASTHTAVPTKPQRVSSALSTSSLSSSASQQTVMQQDFDNRNRTSPNGRSREISRSPRGRGQGELRDSDKEKDRDNRSTASSQKTALAFPRPPLAPSLSELSAGKSSARSSESRPTLLETVRLYIAQLRHPTSSSSSFSVSIPIIVVALSVVIPLLAFIIRIRGTRSLRRSRNVSGAKRLVGPPSSVEGRGSVGAVRWLFDAVKDTVVMAGKGLI